MTGVYLNAIETRLVSSLNGTTKILGHRLYLARLQAAMERRRIEIKSVRGRYWKTTSRLPVSHITAVTNLNTHCRTLLMHRIGNIAQLRHNLIAQPELRIERHSATIDRRVGQCSHTYTTASNADVIVLQRLGRTEILTHRLECRRANRTVTERNRAQFIGGKEY